MSDEEERMLLVEDAARRLRLAPKTVRKYLRERRLLGIKTGQAQGAQWRIAESEIERFSREGPAEPGK